MRPFSRARFIHSLANQVIHYFINFIPKGDLAFEPFYVPFGFFVCSHSDTSVYQLNSIRCLLGNGLFFDSVSGAPIIIGLVVHMDITVFIAEFRVDLPFTVVECDLYIRAMTRVDRADIVFAAQKSEVYFGYMFRQSVFRSSDLL